MQVFLACNVERVFVTERTMGCLIHNGVYMSREIFSRYGERKTKSFSYSTWPSIGCEFQEEKKICDEGYLLSTCSSDDRRCRLPADTFDLLSGEPKSVS
ncbi:Uncharacterized protein APZ42_012341 [Daphnia magna]|uniref:Uncharacterized protein n=1 Tax=Daphnia magna TaxID=35525 RepID=A0A162RXE7_9CRUS|nr:Uncharacterized protein APZ42_012341 [Daphnia magna]